ncbi:MAG: hypothetical protein HOH74_31600, partial [Gemmatimonadetes bacterium]|nr:hypothetical protein [Gemmatimonadota bacterium]
MFTELGHPGREQFIHLQGTGILLQILAEGFVPVEDLALDAQHPWHRPLSRIHPGDGLRWSIDHDAHHLLSTTADDGQLQIQARPRVSGEAEITYRAVDDDGEVLKGSFRVTVSAGAPLLALGPVTLQEDDMPHLLGDVVSARAPVGHRLLLAADAGLTIGSGADGWSVAGAPDWSGLSRLTLRLLDDKSVLIDSMQALVTVAPVDDPPELTTGIAALVAMVGTPSWGPYLADLIYDIDDDISRLSVGVHGDEMITAEVQDGRLRFEGQRAGEGVVLLDVADSDGGNWQFSLDVHVVAQAHGPRFLSWATPHLVIGQKQNWTWPSLLSDDGPLGEIQGIIEGSGNVSVWLTTDGIGVEALAAGSGWVRLLVSDSGGNTSSTILPVEVITDGPVDDPVDDLESDFVDPPVDPEPSSPTGEVEGPDAGVGSPDTVRTPENDNPSAQGLADLVMLNLPPRITLVAGTGIDMKLGDLLEGVAVSDVLWAVSGGEWVQAHVDETGTLRLTAPITAAGDDEVMIHVYVAQQRVSASLQIQLEAAPARLSISQIPAIRLTQGATHELDLSSYALDASGNVHWEIGPAQLVTTHIEEGVLLLKAKATQVGEEALRLTATDGTTQASRLLRVVVGPGESQTLRIQAPAPLTMSPGDRVELDLATWVLDGQVTRWEIQTPSATGILTVEGGQLTVQVADDSGPGTQSFQLVAVADLEQILVVLQVEIIPLPALSLTTVPDLHLVAGSRHALLAMGDLVSEADGPVGWQIVDAGQLPTQIGPLDSLIVDARQALPGRQVLRLRATTAARVEDMQIIVRIDAPVVVVSSWQAELTPGVVARLSLDAQAPDLLVPPEWHVRQVGSGITAAWDTSARRLTVVAEQPGQVHVEARLGSGLAVATSILTIRLLSEPNQTEPVAADSGATGSGQGEA